MQNQVKIAAYSRNKQGDEMLSVLVTFPRIILSEVNTHRMLCKNTSSSRAIPFLKMVESVVANPFIPFAFQKHHSGMQGSEYLDRNEEVTLLTFLNKLIDESKNLTDNPKEQEKVHKRIKELSLIIETYTPISQKFVKRTLEDWWLYSRDKAVQSASIMYAMGVTKQLCNRILEPFMWTTMLITGSVEHGWKNFFNLRCPAYTLTSYDEYEDNLQEFVFKSKKETLKGNSNWYVRKDSNKKLGKLIADFTEEDWKYINKSQAEIHIQDLAEKIYDALNEATPKLLNPGDWHIPMIEVIED